MEADVGSVELGFVEAVTDLWKLKSKYFPSKTGGKPAWLRPKGLPSPEELQCAKCLKPMNFLLQIYAPVEQLARAFHRTIFVFVCKTPECYSSPNDSQTFHVFRSQLNRKNEFYDFEPPPETETESTSETVSADHQPLCALCGCLGPKRCIRCHTNYCSKEHQTLDWKSGHKTSCKESGNPINSKNSSEHLILELEIVTETEENSPDEEDEQAIAERGDLGDSSRRQGSTDLSQYEESELSQYAMPSHKSEKQFRKFSKRVSREPDQVIRYQRGGKPLWVSPDHIPHKDSIPPCECGGSRQFEFQILPQLLNYLKLDTMEVGVDWGTVAIYTCSRSCDSNNRDYHTEFVWKQDFLASNSMAF